MIVIVFEVEFVLHSIVQSVSDRLSDDLFWHNVFALVSVYLEGVFTAHVGRIDVILVLKNNYSSFRCNQSLCTCMISGHIYLGNKDVLHIYRN